MNSKIFTRMLSAAMAFLMILGMFPVGAFAAETDGEETKVPAVLTVSVVGKDDNKPIQGAEVYVAGIDSDPSTPDVAEPFVTVKGEGEDAEPQVQIPDLEVGAKYTLTVKHADYVDEIKEIEIDKEEAETIVEMTALVNVDVIVSDKEGSVAGASVTVGAEETPRGVTVIAKEGDPAKLTLEKLIPDETYTVTVAAAGHLTATETFTCEAKTIAEGVEIKLTNLYDVELIVKDNASDPQPVKHAAVTVTDENGVKVADYETDESGKVILKDLVDGKEYTVAATCVGYKEGSKIIVCSKEVTAEDRTVVMERTDVKLIFENDIEEDLDYVTVTIGDDIYRAHEDKEIILAGLEYNRTYTAEISRNYHDAKTVEFTVDDDTIKNGKVIQLERSVKDIVLTVTADGKALENADVSVDGENVGKTDENGILTLTGLRYLQKYAVTVSCDAHDPASVEVQWSKKNENPAPAVDLEPYEYVDIAGEIQCEEKSVEDVKVILTKRTYIGADEYAKTEVIPVDGKFSFENVEKQLFVKVDIVDVDGVDKYSDVKLTEKDLDFENTNKIEIFRNVYKVTVQEVEGGTVEFITHEAKKDKKTWTAEVKYGEDVTLQIAASNQNGVFTHCIYGLKQDGAEISEASGETTYEHTIENVTEDHTVTLEFSEDTKIIIFYLNDEGRPQEKVKDDEYKNITVENLKVEKHGDAFDVTYRATKNFRISSVKIMREEEQTFEGNDKQVFKDEGITIEEGRHRKYQIVVKLDRFDIKTGELKNGKIAVEDKDSTPGDDKVDYNRSAVMTITPQEAQDEDGETYYTYLADLRIRGEGSKESSSVLSEVNYDAELPSYTLKNVRENKKVSATFKRIQMKKNAEGKVLHLDATVVVIPGAGVYESEGTYYMPKGTAVIIKSAEANERISRSPTGPFTTSIEITETAGLADEIDVLYLLKNGVVTQSTGVIKAISDRSKPSIKAELKTRLNEETGKQDAAIFVINVEDGEGAGIRSVVYSTDAQMTNPTEVAVNEDGEYVLIQENVSGTYYFRAIDNVGLESEITSGIEVDCDNSAPVLKVDFKSEWNNSYEVKGYHYFQYVDKNGETHENRYPKPDGLNITIKAKDEVREVSTVTLKIGDKFAREMERSKTADSAGFYTYTATVKPGEVTTLLVNGNETEGESGYLPVVVEAQDTSENKNTSFAEYRFEFYFEKNKPEIKAESVTEVNSVDQDGGKWYQKTNEDTTIVVTITDEESGLNVDTIKVLDALTNSKVYYPAKVKSDGVSVYAKYITEAGHEVASVKDAEKITTVQLTIKIKAPAHTVTAYDFVIEATDNEGNAVTVGSGKEETLTFTIDAEAPEVTKIDIGGKVGVAVSPEDYGYFFHEDTVVKVYATDNDGSGIEKISFYKTAKGENKPSAVETKVPKEENGRFVAEFVVPEAFKGQVYAYATDNVGNVGAEKNPTGLTIIESQESHDAREADGIEDHVKLELPETDVYDTKVQESRPLYTMVEYEYDKDGNVKLDKKGNPIVKTDEDGKPVAKYKDGVPVTITISDTFNGIKSVKFSVTAKEDTDQNITQDTFELNSTTLMTVDGQQVTKKAKTGITWIAEKTDRNIYETLTGTLLVKHNSNNITVKVTMTDMSDNVTTDEIKLSIDNTPPEIEVNHVSYSSKDKGKATSRRTAMDKRGQTPYFVGFKTEEHKQKTPYDIYGNSTLQVKIVERNLKVEDIQKAAMKLYPTGDLKKVEEKDLTQNLEVYGPFEDVKDGDTKVRVDAGYPYSDRTYYLVELKDCTESGTTGGTYKSSFAVKDLLGNTASVEENFVIDERAPEISIVFDNNEARNEKYYNTDRTATITVKERNFNHSSLKIDGAATLDGAAAKFPEIGTWVSDGTMTTHTAKVVFNSDAEYTKFAVTYTDLARYSSSDSAKDFVLDKTAPVLTIEDVLDKSANNGTVAPRITYTDINLDLEEVEITLTGVNKGEVEYEAVKKDVEHGEELTYNDFAHTKDVDDVYTLYAHAIDLAGNVTTQTISFSCNRFGSVFDLSSIKDMLGKYNQQERTIVVTETNVDALDLEAVRVTLTKNGTPVDLIAGTDYTVQMVGGEGTWHQYIYKIESALFQDDGSYSLYLYTVDAAGNVNENIDDTKEAQIAFGIDKTKPIVTPIDLESNVQYPVESKTVSFEIKDNLLLQSVKIYLNDEEVTYIEDGDSYIFDIPMSNQEQTVRAIATDAAGNEEEALVEDFLVTTNFFIRWYYNTPLFIGSVVLMGAMMGGLIWWLIALLTKKKKDEKEVTA